MNPPNWYRSVGDWWIKYASGNRQKFNSDHHSRYNKCSIAHHYFWWNPLNIYCKFVHDDYDWGIMRKTSPIHNVLLRKLYVLIRFSVPEFSRQRFVYLNAPKTSYHNRQNELKYVSSSLSSSPSLNSNRIILWKLYACSNVEIQQKWKEIFVWIKF